MTTNTSPTLDSSTAPPARDSTVSRLPDTDLRLLLLIRHFELIILDLFARGKIHGTTHTCMGQEYIPVALAPLVGDEDFVFSNHRGHGHYLARFGDPRSLLAEVMGRQGAVCNGVGGSQHIHRGRYLSTGVQGESLPVAAGVALHLRRAEPGRLALVHIGDGTWGEGAVYEALNMAALWQLPLAVVVENNGVAQSTPTAAQMAGTIGGRAHAFGIIHYQTASVDINAIRAEVEPVLGTARRCQPVVIEFTTVRLGPHSKGDDTRSPAELARAQERDWYQLYAAAFPDQFQACEQASLTLLDNAVREVDARAPSDWPEMP